MSPSGPVRVIPAHGRDVYELMIKIPQAMADAVASADDLLHVSILPGKISGLDAVLIVREHNWSGWAPPDPSNVDG